MLEDESRLPLSVDWQNNDVGKNVEEMVKEV